MADKLYGVYKEVGKEPRPKVIWNTKEDIEKLIGGEFESIKSEEFTIIYKKNSESMLANVCIDLKGRGIGTSIKGKLFAVKENEKGEFVSFSSVEELTKVAKFLNKQGLDYTKFDEHGKFLTRAERKKRAYQEKIKRKQEIQNVNDLSVSNKYFEDNFRLVPVINNEQDNNPSNLNEDATESKKESASTNNSNIQNNKGKLILERTPDSSTSSESAGSEIPKIVMGDETVFKMLLKVQLIILEFLRKAVDESDEE